VVRCAHEQPREVFVLSQEEPMKEIGSGLSDTPKVVKLSGLPNLPYDHINRSIGLNPFEVVNCYKPRRPLDLLLSS
jgi:hypothetical protein